MSRLSVIQLAQLPPMQVLETIDTEAIITARMAKVVEYWQANDPPNAGQYDVGALEFDPIKINQEVSTYFELMLRDRVNQAARSVTLAFAVGGNLDAIGSRYPGGLPRLPLVSNPRPYVDYPEDWESDDRYRARIWLSPNTLSPHGVYEAYVFWALTADVTLRDVTATAETGTPNVTITCLADGTPITTSFDGNTQDWAISAFPSVAPTIGQLAAVRNYVIDKSRQALTDVLQVQAPRVVHISYSIRYFLFPGWDDGEIRAAIFAAMAALLEKQRFLGYSHVNAAVEAALMVDGVSNVIVDTPTGDTNINSDTIVIVDSVTITFAGRAGIEALDE